MTDTRPPNPDLLFALHLFRAGDLANAASTCSRVLARSPSDFDALHLAGIIEIQRSDFSAAVKFLEKATRRRKDSSEGFTHLAIALTESGRAKEAITAYRRALTIDKRLFPAAYNLAKILTSTNRLEEARLAYQQAIAINPSSADAWSNFGSLLERMGQPLESEECWAKCLEIDPKFPLARGNLLHYRMQKCNWSDFQGQLASFLSDIAEGVPVKPFCALGLPLPAATHLKCARDYIHYIAPASERPCERRPSAGGRIRVGYLCADFREHATAFLMAGVFEHHDKSRFEIFAFSTGPAKSDPMKTRLAGAFDHLFEVGVLDDARIAALVKEKNIDILVDLNGATLGGRVGILALRPCSIQVTYLAFPGTSGAPFIDYIIADHVTAPLGSEGEFSEKIIRLPNCYQCNDSFEEFSVEETSREKHGLPNGAFVYCSFNNSFKITPDIFDIWMRLLRNDDNSVLWLFADNQVAVKNLRLEAEKRDVGSGRLIFADRIPRPQHLERHRHADLFLDTIYCNAHTTASDALRTGLPIVTCRSESFAGRVCASILTSAGLQDLVASDLAEYEALAAKIARDPEKLSALRKRVASGVRNGPLFDPALYTKNLEDAFVHILKDQSRIAFSPQ